MRRQVLMRKGSAVAVAAVALTSLAVGPAAATGRGPTPEVAWKTCPAYSDDVLRALGVPDEKLPRVRSQLTRMECGTVSVPLDHRAPGGRRIDVAITRLKAVDQAHRLGSLAVNPGGPGGSGYLMGVQIGSLTTDEAARLGDRYDLIGFDPRGVGLSTHVDCEPLEHEGEPPTGPITKEAAKAEYDLEVAFNKACGDSDPEFLRRLTTENVARDLDLVRGALHERKMNFLGVSWGTWLGAVYRSAFPATAGRVFLDSVAPPHFRIDDFEDARAMATERDSTRLMAWLARFDDTYGLGTTQEQVRATVVALVRDFDANPRHYTDLPRAVDGEIIAMSAAQPSRAWPMVGQVLKALRESTGPTAPPIFKDIVVGPPETPPPPGTPESGNRTMNQAAFCNEDPSRLDFEHAWADFRQRLAANPLTGRALRFSAGCAGWPLPVQEYRLRHGTGSLVLVGHRHESVSVFEWTAEMKAAAGGKAYTVEDDVHGSVLRVPECSADMLAYFTTGRIDDGCQGVPLPDGPDASGLMSLAPTG
ncbi:alpha/beta fold hydrolase [Umezawaea sp. Da 62-37]|uniref:alpha/beta fold hydrolase n=1 Tax=Umezawaea sp. Da 62-37 TaxID=3075927 RepID=UPI0028F72A8C|nr:alpha/beta fold hydrolase [Umezawaea sp. Da 62-37]WNV88521.1 alpha/beta fold hydrolase [Umezawaea sp. Da 62-37]